MRPIEVLEGVDENDKIRNSGIPVDYGFREAKCP